MIWAAFATDGGDIGSAEKTKPSIRRVRIDRARIFKPQGPKRAKVSNASIYHRLPCQQVQSTRGAQHAHAPRRSCRTWLRQIVPFGHKVLTTGIKEHRVEGVRDGDVGKCSESRLSPLMRS